MMSGESTCQILELHHMLGKRWTLPLLFELHKRRMTFSQLRKRTSRQINTTLLSCLLKDLVRYHIVQKLEGKERKILYSRSIKKTAHEEKFGYSLTASGENLLELIFKMKELASENNFSFSEHCKSNACFDCTRFMQKNCFGRRFHQ